MNKQEFKQILTELLAIKKNEDNLNEAFQRFEPDWNYLCFGRYETLVVNVLKLVMEDKEDWIGYWIYELNCGKDAKAGSVTIKGKNIPIKTISNLYDLIKIRYCEKRNKMI